jgi:hypothetical protein
MAGSLIITNGDVAGELLRRTLAGVEVLPWRDVLHEGPVPLTLTLTELTEIRAQYLAKIGAGDLDQLRAELQARDRGLARSAQFDRVALWFEHDLYDQLQLLQVLDWFNGHRREKEPLTLVQATEFLGNQTPQALLGLQHAQKPVTAEQLALASAAWAAFRAPTPESWSDLLRRDLSALPFLKPAVTRMLEELPGPDGLSRTERTMLAALRQGELTPPVLFAAVQRQEEAVFMGDWSFWRLLDGLALAPNPLIAGLEGAPFGSDGTNGNVPYFKSRLRLTQLGAEIASGRDDYARHNRIDRWWGGTHLSNGSLWRWDASGQRLIAPRS